MLKKLTISFGVFCLLNFQVKIFAFALLGPVQPWMQATNGVIQSGDIGGPMDVGNGYRWNVPVLTYGFDQSFLDYFGTNGVAAVEGAIQILNNLPPASHLAPTNFPFETQNINYYAQPQSLLDLKSETLSLLLEHMGLAPPTKNIFVLRQWSPRFIPPSPNQFTSELAWLDWAYPDFISQLNFDPQTLTSSHYVNGTLYSAEIGIYPNQYLTLPFGVDIFADTYTAVADFGLFQGGFYTGLTYDDVGGLSYLLSTNNVNYEMLLLGVIGVGSNANTFINGAKRPGVDKITFVPQSVNPVSGNFLPMTNYYTDNYFSNDILKQQPLARVVTQPDFVFCAADVSSGSPQVPLYARTGTTNWLNNAAANGNTNGAGPGVIQPQVQIVFNKLGQILETGSDDQVYDYSQYWSSYDDSPNPPVAYPKFQAGTNQMTVRMWLMFGTRFQKSFEWKPSGMSGAQYFMQASTNLVNWTTLFAVTNNGSICTYFNVNPPSRNRFYRLMPQ